MEQINLAIIEDDPLIRESLEGYLGANKAISINVVAGSVEHFLEITKVLPPAVNIILLDIGLPGMSGLEGIRHIRLVFPEADIIMLTTFEEDDKIFKALCAGACSYISKRTSLVHIQEALFVVRRGGSYMSPSIARKIAQHFMPRQRKEEDLLSPRQKQIVDGIVEGYSYKMIADKLSISLDTVRDHIKLPGLGSEQQSGGDPKVAGRGNLNRTPERSNQGGFGLPKIPDFKFRKYNLP